MIQMQLWHHSLDKKSCLDRKRLNIREDSLRPLQFNVIRDNNHPFARVSSCFQPPLHKYLHTLAIVARSPRRICVETTEVRWTRERFQTVVKACSNLIEAFVVR